jgi:hypothetical protein
MLFFGLVRIAGGGGGRLRLNSVISRVSAPGNDATMIR